MTTVSHLSTGWYHEGALRALGITADVELDGAGQATVRLSLDDLDTLTALPMSQVREEAIRDAAYAMGHEDGSNAGYGQAVSDIRGEYGEAWVAVLDKLKEAHAEGYTQAIKDLKAWRKS